MKKEPSAIMRLNVIKLTAACLSLLFVAATVFSVPVFRAAATETEKTVFDFSALVPSSELPRVNVRYGETISERGSSVSDTVAGKISAGNGNILLNTVKSGDGDGYAFFGFPVKNNAFDKNGAVIEYSVDSDAEIFFRAISGGTLFFGAAEKVSAALTGERKSIKLDDFETADGRKISENDIKNISELQIGITAQSKPLRMFVRQILSVQKLEKPILTYEKALDFSEYSAGQKVDGFTARTNYNWNTDGNEWSGKAALSVSAGDGFVGLSAKISDDYKSWGYGEEGWQSNRMGISFTLPIENKDFGSGLSLNISLSRKLRMYYRVKSGNDWYYIGVGSFSSQNGNIAYTEAFSAYKNVKLNFSDFINKSGKKMTDAEISEISAFQICCIAPDSTANIRIKEVRKAVISDIAYNSVYDFTAIKSGSQTPDISSTVNSSATCGGNDESDSAYTDVRSGDGCAILSAMLSEESAASGKKVYTAFSFKTNPTDMFGDGIKIDYTLSQSTELFFRAKTGGAYLYYGIKNGNIKETAAATKTKSVKLYYSDFISETGATPSNAELKKIESFEICLKAPKNAVNIGISKISVINPRSVDEFTAVRDYTVLKSGDKSPEITAKVGANWNSNGNEWGGKATAQVSSADGYAKLTSKISDDYYSWGYADDGWQDNRCSIFYSIPMREGELDSEGVAFDYRLSENLKIYYRAYSRGKLFCCGAWSVDVPPTYASAETTRKTLRFSDFKCNGAAMTREDAAAIEYVQICCIAPVKNTVLSLYGIYALNAYPKEEPKLSTVMDYSALTAESDTPTVKIAVGMSYSSDANEWSGKAAVSVKSELGGIAISSKIDKDFNSWGYGYGGWNNEKGLVTVSCRFPTGKGNLDGSGVAIEYALEKSMPVFYRVHTKAGNGNMFFSDVTPGKSCAYTASILAASEKYTLKQIKYAGFKDKNGVSMTADDIKKVDYFDICFAAPSEQTALKIRKIYVIDPNEKDDYTLDDVIDYTRLKTESKAPAITYTVDDRWDHPWNGRSGKAIVSVKAGNGCAIMRASITEEYKEWGWGIGGWHNSPQCIGFNFAANKGSYNGVGVAFDYTLNTADTNGLAVFYRIYSNGKIFYAEANGGKCCTVEKTSEYRRITLEYSEFTREIRDEGGNTVTETMNADDIRNIDTFQLCFLLPDPDKTAELSVSRVSVLNPIFDYSVIEGFENESENIKTGDTVTVSLNSDNGNRVEGDNSLAVKSGGGEGALTVATSAEVLCGKGFRIWCKGGKGAKINSVSVRLKDGTVIPCLTDIKPKDSGGYLTVNYVKCDITKAISEKINGIVISFSGSETIYFDDLSVINPAIDTNEYMTLEDFDNSMVAPSTFSFNNLPSEIVNESENVYNKNSLHMWYNNTTKSDFWSSFWSAFPKKTMYGDGVRFWMKVKVSGKGNHIQLSHLQIAGMSIDWTDYYNGFEGWVTVPFKSMPEYSEEKIKANVNFAMTIWAPPETKYDLYIDQVQVINPKHTPVAGVSFNSAKIEMFTGGSTLLSVSVTPKYAYNKELIWNSDNPAVADVDANGIVNAYSKGKANITVKTVDGGYTAECRVVVKERDSTASRILYDFDSGQMPSGIAANSCTGQLDYMHVMKGASYKASSAKNTFSVTFTPEKKYQFYGSELSLWIEGNPKSQAVLSLITHSGRNFFKNIEALDEDGYTYDIPYYEFSDAFGAAPSISEITDIASLRLTVNGGSEIYVDEIKVRQPRIYGVDIFPRNDMNGTGITVDDPNGAMGSLVCQIYDISGDTDAEWAQKLLTGNGIDEDNYNVRLFQINFLDRKYSVKNLGKSIRVNLPDGDMYDSPYLWVLKINDNGTITGIKLLKKGDKLNFEIKESGLYAVILRYIGIDEAAEDEDYSYTDYEEYEPEYDSDSEYGNEEKSPVKKAVRRRYKKPTYIETYYYLPWWGIVLCCVGGAALIGGTVLLIMRRRKNKK